LPNHPKYKTIFKLSQLPKSVVACVGERLFCRNCEYPQSYTTFAFQVSTFHASAFQISVDEFQLPTFKFLLINSNFHAFAFQVSADKFQFSRFYFSGFNFSSFNFQVSTSKFQVPSSNFQLPTSNFQVPTFKFLLFRFQFSRFCFVSFCGNKCFFSNCFYLRNFGTTAPQRSRATAGLGLN
jgi:hypothetical protein